MNPTLETLACYYQDFNDLKRWFFDSCKINKKYDNYKVWAHIILNCISDNVKNYHVIPNPASYDVDYVNRIVTEKNEEEDNKEFCTELKQQIAILYNKYNWFRQKLIMNDNGDVAQASSAVEITNEQNLYFFKFSETEVKINGKHLEKLKTMYTGNEENLNFYIFDVIYNYSVLGGYSFHWAIPPKIFDILKVTIDLKAEMFASPLNANARNTLYCSLFVMDKQFGALDSFYNISTNQALEGGYEINPPFIERLFEKSTGIVNKLLQNSEEQEKSLFFFYILPLWEDSNIIESLSKNEFLLGTTTLKSEEGYYYYCYEKSNFIKATFDSVIFLLGTSKMKSIWTPMLEQRILYDFQNKTMLSFPKNQRPKFYNNTLPYKNKSKYSNIQLFKGPGQQQTTTS